MKNGHHNFNGDHGPELVTYIYGEMDDRARASFESHLAGCDDCAAELASVSDARLGVIEWRRNDFDHLSTPAIILPASEPAFSIAPVSAGRSGIAALFESIFSLPVIARVGVGLATAAVVVGIIYY
jgi:anti-sigma factor RsiW